LFTLDELVEAFSIERIGKSGTKFDINKAKWYNEQYLRAKTDAELGAFLKADIEKEELAISEDKAAKIAHIMKDRVTFPQDIWRDSKFMLIAPTTFDQEVASKKWNQEAVSVLTQYIEELEGFTEEFNPEAAKALLEKAAETTGFKLGKVMQAVRLAITGVGGGPDLMAVFSILGKEELAKRIKFALETLSIQS
jgi:glutamyl-tRNA synthetase